MQLAVKGDVSAVMYQALAVQSIGTTGLFEFAYGDLFEHTGSHAGHHVLRRLGFQNDVVDALLMQQLPQQQTRRARTDDRHLRAREAHLNGGGSSATGDCGTLTKRCVS